MPAFPEPRFAHAAGVRRAYREWGDPRTLNTPSKPGAPAQPILLVHGITSNALSWARVGPALGETHYVVAPDLKGHGDSDKPVSGYVHTTVGAELAALCGALGIERVTLIGHSWGGILGVLLATEADLVARLILEDPVLYLTAEQRVRFAADFSQTVGLTPQQAQARYSAATVPAGWTDVDVEGKVDAAVKGSPDAVHAVFGENDPWDLRDRLDRLTCPTLLLQAAPEAGGLVHPDVAARAARSSNVRVVTVAGADHNIHRTAFDRFMREVRAFL